MPYLIKKIVNIGLISSLFLAGFAALPVRADAATFTSIEVQSISGSKATIAWSTSQPTTGVVRYGLSAANLTSFLGDSQLRVDHATQLIHLQERKTYYFAVTARNAAGEEVTSFSFNFATTALTQAEKDEIKSNQQVQQAANDAVGVDGVSASVAAVSWTSAFPTRGTVTWTEVGQTRSRSAGQGNLATSHQLLIKGLKANTAYDFTVTMKDRDNIVTSVRGPFRFTTASSRDQETTALQVAYLGPSNTSDSRLSPTTARVSFTTNHLANATVQYRATGRFTSTGTIKLDRYGYQHDAQLQNLKPNTEYSVTIATRDAFGKSNKLVAARFRTPAVAVAAAPVARVSGASTGPASRGRLVKAAGNSAVYFVYASGRKKVFATEAAFLDYGNRFSDVQTIPAAELAAIPDVRVIKTNLSHTVYKLEGATLRPITSADAFVAAGFSWSEIEIASPADVQSYPLGSSIS